MIVCSRFMSSVIAEIAYGHQVSGSDDSYPQIAERVTAILDGAGTPGLNLVDIFPMCEDRSLIGGHFHFILFLQ